MKANSYFLTLFVTILIIACTSDKIKIQEQTDFNERISLNEKIAERLSKLPLNCLQKEYPNKLNQVLANSDEIGTPAALHPAFYGCFDWHSSVHGHWMLVKLLKDFPDLVEAPNIRKVLLENLNPENIEAEINYFNRISEKSFERPYGWVWLLKLAEELSTWEDYDRKTMYASLKPLADLIVTRYMEFLPKLNYPVRSGEHSNTAFGLIFAWDFAQTTGHDSLSELIKEKAKSFFMNDINCPISWEPGGFDFLSPCLQEADLMRRILDKETFKIWLDKFLPELKNNSFDLSVATVSDRSDGKLVHLDGVNFCRAWCLYGIADVLPEYQHLNIIANKHIEASLPNIVDGDYMGEHWLASFAVWAMNNAEVEQ